MEYFFKCFVKFIPKLQLEAVVVCATLNIISDIFRKFNYSPSKMFIHHYNQMLFKLFPPQFTNSTYYITTMLSHSHCVFHILIQLQVI